VKRFYVAIIAVLAAAAAAWFLEPTGWLTCVFAVLAVSATMMHYAVKNILAVSYRKKLYDLPGGRRIHTTPTPRLGGLAFAPIICCTTILALALHGGLSPAHHVGIPECLTWISALIFIYMTGTIDDLIGVRYYVKLAAQIVAALLVVASGLWINDLGGLFGVWSIPASVGVPLTVLFIVGIINALNLIDGMDGLAAGICMIALVIYGVHCFASERYFFSLVAFSALGTVGPFFYSNVRGLGLRRHKLFMGDTGSQTLGLVISVLAVGQIMNSGTVLAKQDFILALSPLVVPVFDVAHVVFFRMLRGNHPFHPDMTHIHHRLTRWGFTPRGAVGFILFLSAIYVAVNLLLAPYVGMTVILVLDVAAWCLLNGAIAAYARRRVAAKDKSYSYKIENSETNINAKLLKS
jgi:UDP-N-acetylmuramyl pentapeptide phosphotransferase/UDP-N-acetylglucosamine-1-phosphate transferase